MSRTSTAEIELAPHIVEQSRPDAPYDLTDAEPAEWRAIVASMPPTHFSRGNYPLLAQLCRHIVTSRQVAQLKDQCTKAKKIDAKLFTHLLSLQDKETKSIMYLCRSMRLTQQSIYRGELVGVRPLKGNAEADATMKNPWEPEDDE